MFLKPKHGFNEHQKNELFEAISLEAVFYQSDCFYYDLIQNDVSERNRIGTENYELADYDKTNEGFIFDESPLNLKVDRNQSYVKKRKEKLMKTSKEDAFVEYYLVKWKINSSGGIMKTI